MKEIIKKVKTLMTVRTEFKVPENVEECNSLMCSKCAYQGNYVSFEKCPHRTVMNYFEGKEGGF